MSDFAWKENKVTAAIADEDGNWQYRTFNSWKEAREAVNEARREGKAAVFYDGATFPYPPENFGRSENSKDLPLL